MADQLFDGVVEEGRGGGTWVAVPFDRAEDKTNLAPMLGRHVLGLRKSIQDALGKGVEASEFFDSLSFRIRQKPA